MTTAARVAALRQWIEDNDPDPDEIAAFLATLEPEDAAAVEHALDEVMGRRSYRDDPVRFVLECIEFPEGEAPAPYQLEALRRLHQRKRLSVRALHGVGKTAILAWLILWFALTRDPDNWKIITTASVWRQLSKFLWPEVHKWSRRLRWDKLGRRPFRLKRELLDMAIKLEGGEASAMASDDETALEGAHADSVLMVYDEAKAIPDATFDATEGVFATEDAAKGKEVFGISMSTPGKPIGRFHDIQSRKPGTENWDVMHITLEDAIAAGRVSSKWAEQMAKLWGRDSALYRNRVLGEFADADGTSVIALEWVEAANERWHAWADDPSASGYVTAAGVDVARYGDDKTVIALRCGDVVARLDTHGKISTASTLGYCQAYSTRWPSAVFVVDVIGVGAGVVDGLREWNAPTVAFVANGRTDQKDRTGSFGFDSQRSAAWWTLRELLDPAYGPTLALPPDPELMGDLTAPTWEVIGGGKIKVEPKDKFKARLGRSPDKGDAVVMAFVADMHAGQFVMAPAHERRRGDDPNVLTQDF